MAKERKQAIIRGNQSSSDHRRERRPPLASRPSCGRNPPQACLLYIAQSQIFANLLSPLRMVTPKDLIDGGGTGQGQKLQKQLLFVWKKFFRDGPEVVAFSVLKATIWTRED